MLSETMDEPRQPRYSISPHKGRRAILSSGAPGLRLFVERGLTIDEASLARYPDQSVFLDGVFSGAPFMNNERRQYSLDHHAGCVRPFTLATCEQAAVLVKEGLPLSEGVWELYVNEPDLDAVLAAWLLLGHEALTRDDDRLLWQVMPLVRTEGTIDAYGLGLGVVSGLSREAWEVLRTRLDGLRAREAELRREGRWDDCDPLAYTRDLLEQFDLLLLPPEHRDGPGEVEELDRIPLPNGRVGVLCRARQGIYAAEQVLRQRHGKRLGIVVLDSGGGRFTLLQADPFLRQALPALYAVLNVADPGDGAHPEDRWGGSDVIGGSPRKAGSTLTGRQVLERVAEVYGSPGWLRRRLGWLGR